MHLHVLQSVQILVEGLSKVKGQRQVESRSRETMRRLQEELPPSKAHTENT